MVGQRRQDPAASCLGLVEVAGGEDLSLGHVEEVGVNVRAYHFDEVKGERVPGLGVVVQEAECGVESEYEEERACIRPQRGHRDS